MSIRDGLESWREVWQICADEMVKMRRSPLPAGKQALEQHPLEPTARA